MAAPGLDAVCDRRIQGQSFTKGGLFGFAFWANSAASASMACHQPEVWYGPQSGLGHGGGEVVVETVEEFAE